MTDPYRVLVTGSRDWQDEELIRHQLTRVWLTVDRPFTVIHGACPTGADWMASDWVANMLEAEMGDVREEPHPANWRPNGKLDRSAGFRRNAEMVQLGADICLAFIRDNSRGASHTAALAEQAGITVRKWTA
jgi:hypothetical protein